MAAAAATVGVDEAGADDDLDADKELAEADVAGRASAGGNGGAGCQQMKLCARRDTGRTGAEARRRAVVGPRDREGRRRCERVGRRLLADVDKADLVLGVDVDDAEREDEGALRAVDRVEQGKSAVEDRLLRVVQEDVEAVADQWAGGTGQRVRRRDRGRAASGRSTHVAGSPLPTTTGEAGPGGKVSQHDWWDGERRAGGQQGAEERRTRTSSTRACCFRATSSRSAS